MFTLLCIYYGRENYFRSGVGDLAYHSYLPFCLLFCFGVFRGGVMGYDASRIDDAGVAGSNLSGDLYPDVGKSSESGVGGSE